MTHATGEKRHHATSLAKKKRKHDAHLKRLQLYAVITGVVGLLMTIIRLIFSLMH